MRMRMLLGGYAGSTKDECCLIRMRMLPHTYAYATDAALRMVRRPATKHVCCLIRMRMLQVPPCVWFEDQLQNTDHVGVTALHAAVQVVKFVVKLVVKR